MPWFFGLYFLSTSLLHWREHRIFNASGAIGAQLRAAARLKRVHALNQAYCSDGNQIILIAAGNRIFSGDMRTQTKVMLNQFFPRSLIPLRCKFNKFRFFFPIQRLRKRISPRKIPQHIQRILQQKYQQLFHHVNHPGKSMRREGRTIPATVAPGTDVSFPQDDPNSASGIARSGPSSFVLADIGIYQVLFQVSVTEAGQLILTLDGQDLAYTVVGRATGTSQIIGMSIVETTAINAILTVRNPAGNAAALTITPLAGGTRPVSAHLVITQLQ